MQYPDYGSPTNDLLVDAIGSRSTGTGAMGGGDPGILIRV